jgi:hypothetical protein
MTALYADPLWLTRLSWLCAQRAAMLWHEGNLATIEAAVKLCERKR